MVKEKPLEELVVGKTYRVDKIKERLKYIGDSNHGEEGVEKLISVYLDWNGNKGYAMKKIGSDRLEVLRVYKLSDDVPPKKED